DAPDLERWCLVILSNQGFNGLETCPIKISAQHEVQSQRNDQSKPKPTALFAARKQPFGLESVEVVEIRNSHCLPGSQHTTFGVWSMLDLGSKLQGNTPPKSGVFGSEAEINLSTAARLLDERSRSTPNFIGHARLG